MLGGFEQRHRVAKSWTQLKRLSMSRHGMTWSDLILKWPTDYCVDSSLQGKQWWRKDDQLGASCCNPRERWWWLLPTVMVVVERRWEVVWLSMNSEGPLWVESVEREEWKMTRGLLMGEVNWKNKVFIFWDGEDQRWVSLWGWYKLEAPNINSKWRCWVGSYLQF